jgi:hypothetical protein
LRKDHQALDNKSGVKLNQASPQNPRSATQRNASCLFGLAGNPPRRGGCDPVLRRDAGNSHFPVWVLLPPQHNLFQPFRGPVLAPKLSKIAQRQNDYVRSVWRENMAGVDSSRFIFLDETRRFVERAFAFIASSPAPRAATAPSQCSRWTASLGFQSPGPRGLTLELSRTIYAQCYSQF